MSKQPIWLCGQKLRHILNSYNIVSWVQWTPPNINVIPINKYDLHILMHDTSTEHESKHWQPILWTLESKVPTHPTLCYMDLSWNTTFLEAMKPKPQLDITSPLNRDRWCHFWSWMTRRILVVSKGYRIIHYTFNFPLWMSLSNTTNPRPSSKCP